MDYDIEKEKMAKLIAHKRIEIAHKFNLSCDLILGDYNVFEMVYKQRYENYPILCSVKEVEMVEGTMDSLKNEDKKSKPTRKENVISYFGAVIFLFCLILFIGLINNGVGCISELYIAILIISMVACLLSSVINYALERYIPSFLMKIIKC